MANQNFWNFWNPSSIGQSEFLEFFGILTFLSTIIAEETRKDGENDGKMIEISKTASSSQRDKTANYTTEDKDYTVSIINLSKPLLQLNIFH